MQVGDKVHRLSQNGKPMMASNGAYKLVGTVEAVTPGRLVRVRWITRGTIDHAITYDSPNSLRLVKETNR